MAGLKKITIVLLALLLCSSFIYGQGTMRISPVPPKKTTPTPDNAPLNPRMFIMLILRYKMQPIKLIPEYVAKPYTGKVPVYNLEKLDPELFKIYKSPNLSVLPNQNYLLTVSRDADKLQTISFATPPIKMPPPEVEPVNTLSMRNNKIPGSDKPGVGGPNASKIAVPKVPVPIPDPEAVPVKPKSPIAIPDESVALQNVNKNQHVNLAERTPLPSKHKSGKKGYKNIVYEKPVVREINKGEATNNTNGQSNSTSAFRSDIPIIYDTIRAGRRRGVQEEMVVTSHHDTIYIVPGDYEDTYVETSIKPTERPSVMKEGTCRCVDMTMTAQDTINFEDYVNYGFTFKNNCKEYVYVHSFSFRFSVTEQTGYPAKRIRRIDFVKRFDYPEFVKIRPGQTYEYHFADDPFFEYELSRGKQYKFTFMYNNFSNRYPSAPQQTHLCNDPRDKVIYVQ